MSNQKYVSSVKTINWSNKIVYDKLSNLEFLNFMFSPENMERVKSQMGDKAPKMNIKNFIADKDTCQFELAGMGKISLKIIERKELKLIKIISDDKNPIRFILWIQLLPRNEYSCKMRISLQPELNMVMKMIIGKKLDTGIEQIADSLAQIPYGIIPANEN